jgi:ElaB/YqjD/DUF883 family membrane-anchored ribosome-binding protein
MALHLRRSGSAASLDVGEIGRLLHDLSGPLAQLAALVSANAREVGNAVPHRVSETLADISERVRTTVGERARNVGAEATRLGGGAWHKLEDEIVHRPFVALAIAAGIGFLIGALNRR